MPGSVRNLLNALRALTLLSLPPAAACGQAPDVPVPEDPSGAEVVARTLGRWLEDAEREMASLEDILLPVRLLRPAEEDALRRFPNAAHLARARALGVPPVSGRDAAESLRRQGRLVRLDEESPYWTVRRLDHSLPLATPDVHALLTEIGRRLQEELTRLGLPPFRVEISSALRTADLQQALQQSNENAARDRSPHEYGTTVDVAYDGFAAPFAPRAQAMPEEESASGLLQDRLRASLLERVAARKSRELQAILGRILSEMQEEGDVLVTLEKQQPVFHVTVARRFR